MKSLSVILLLAFSLTACGSMDFKKQFENRLSCTVDKSSLYTISLYGPLGIAAKIADADAKVVCK